MSICTLPRPSRRPATRRSGFTLVELLVVIGIILAILAIATPVIFKMRRSAEVQSVKNDFNVISIGIEEYKKDFKDYPRPPSNARNTRILARALIAPADAAVDGADGPGFRVVYDTTTKKGGKVYGPYLPPDRFRLSDSKAEILDRSGMPIEYFVSWRNYATPAPPLFTADTGVFDHRMATDSNVNVSPIKYLQKAMGDDNKNDRIDGTEKLHPQPLPPFILLSRGPTRKWSDDATRDNNFGKTTEITNFDKR